MHRLNNISNLKQATGITLGILAAIVILISQSFYFDYVAGTESNIKTEQTDQEQPILKIGQQVVVQAAEITLQNVLHFISEIFFDDSSEVHINTALLPQFNSLFNTLFRLIISPNAP